jgi:integrase
MKMKLTDAACRTKPDRKRTLKLSDGGGMFLQITPGGGRNWRFSYRRPVSKAQNTIAFGTYPEVSLDLARQRRKEARELVAKGMDPSEVRKETAKDQERAADAATSFREIAERWWQAKMVRQDRATGTLKRDGFLRQQLIAEFGNRQIGDIESREVIRFLERIGSEGHLEKAHRLRAMMARIYRYAIKACDACKHNPAADLTDAVTIPPERHLAALIDPAAVGQLMRDIRDYKGKKRDGILTRSALQFQALVWQRPGNVASMEWSEIDWDKHFWIIPLAKMKSRNKKGAKDHKVPLSTQAISILKNLQKVSAVGRYVFSISSKRMSENTLNMALRAMGYDTQTQHCAHGFRSTASTILNEEMQFNKDLIEAQLAHGDEDKVRGAYNRAEWLDLRFKMMQHWADKLDELRDAVTITTNREDRRQPDHQRRVSLARSTGRTTPHASNVRGRTRAAGLRRKPIKDGRQPISHGGLPECPAANERKVSSKS